LHRLLAQAVAVRYRSDDATMAPSQVVLKLAGQLADRGITRDSRITKVLLLPGHFGFELGVLRFKLAQAADIRTIGGADEVRQHVHLGED
jgi:hypothetical protein